MFYGTVDGWFRAVDARTGKVLWSQKLGSGIVAQPMTFTGPDGQQYVAVYAGVGGAAMVESKQAGFPARGNTLYVFSLGGKGSAERGRDAGHQTAGPALRRQSRSSENGAMKWTLAILLGLRWPWPAAVRAGPQASTQAAPARPNLDALPAAATLPAASNRTSAARHPQSIGGPARGHRRRQTPLRPDELRGLPRL